MEWFLSHCTAILVALKSEPFDETEQAFFAFVSWQALFRFLSRVDFYHELPRWTSIKVFCHTKRIKFVKFQMVHVSPPNRRRRETAQGTRPGYHQHSRLRLSTLFPSPMAGTCNHQTTWVGNTGCIWMLWWPKTKTNHETQRPVMLGTGKMVARPWLSTQKQKQNKTNKVHNNACKSYLTCELLNVFFLTSYLQLEKKYVRKVNTYKKYEWGHETPSYFEVDQGMPAQHDLYVFSKSLVSCKKTLGLITNIYWWDLHKVERSDFRPVVKIADQIWNHVTTKIFQKI